MVMVMVMVIIMVMVLNQSRTWPLVSGHCHEMCQEVLFIRRCTDKINFIYFLCILQAQFCEIMFCQIKIEKFSAILFIATVSLESFEPLKRQAILVLLHFLKLLRACFFTQHSRPIDRNGCKSQPKSKSRQVSEPWQSFVIIKILMAIYQASSITFHNFHYIS